MVGLCKRSMYLSRIGILIGALILGTLASTTVLADGVSFDNVVAVQNGNRIDLATNQGTTLNGTQLDFLLDIHGATPAAGVHTLRVIFEETGAPPLTQTFRVPLFDGLPPDYSQLFSFQVTNPSFNGTPVMLTVQLLEDLSGAIIQRQVYNFNVAQPVPEPATSTLLALSVAGLIARRRSRKRSLRLRG
jgi:hypothetical protein